jgi:hypothetical protein
MYPITQNREPMFTTISQYFQKNPFYSLQQNRIENEREKKCQELFKEFMKRCEYLYDFIYAEPNPHDGPPSREVFKKLYNDHVDEVSKVYQSLIECNCDIERMKKNPPPGMNKRTLEHGTEGIFFFERKQQKAQKKNLT